MRVPLITLHRRAIEHLGLNHAIEASLVSGEGETLVTSWNWDEDVVDSTPAEHPVALTVYVWEEADE